jgi:LysR family transcriptional regulator of beta-lactamase
MQAFAQWLLAQAHSASAGLPAPDAAAPEAKHAPFEDH